MDTGQYTVSATASAMGSGGCTGGLILVAQVSNLFSIYIGANSSVTINNGFELKAGAAMDFLGWASPPNDLSQIFVICPALGLLTAPKLCWIKQS
jgi:hypothetical protein